MFAPPPARNACANFVGYGLQPDQCIHCGKSSREHARVALQSQIDAAVAAEREACAKIAEEKAELAWKIYKGVLPENGSLQRGDSYTEGQSDAAGGIAAAIRARRGKQC